MRAMRGHALLGVRQVQVRAELVAQALHLDDCVVLPVSSRLDARDERRYVDALDLLGLVVVVRLGDLVAPSETVRGFVTSPHDRHDCLPAEAQRLLHFNCR